MIMRKTEMKVNQPLFLEFFTALEGAIRDLSVDSSPDFGKQAFFPTADFARAFGFRR